MNPTRPLLILALPLIAVAIGACGSSGSSGSSSKVSLVAYSTPKEAYAAIIPAFQKTPAGKGVQVTTSYGNSGDQARAIVAGQPASVAALSLAPDVTKLVKAKLVAPDWDATPTKGIVTRSVVVIAVRKGNPKHITSFDDLAKPGIKVLTPNPFTSGGARWNVMAAYGSQIAEGKTPAQADDYLAKLFRNVVVQDKAARDATQNFAGGKGDALISYENEAITAQQNGVKLDYVIPAATILIENPIAVLANAGPKAKAFADYAVSEPAQKIFAAKGYRSVIPALVDKKTYPDPPKEFTIAKFGGWDAVMKKFFDPTNSVMQKIEAGLGVSTS